MARAADFDLASALARPGFTPGQRDIGALVDLIATDEDATVRASPALATLGEPARVAVVERIGAEDDDGGAARLVQTLGLMMRANDRDARAAVIECVGDVRVRVRRAAIVALGKLGATRERGEDVSAETQGGRLELREGARRRSERRAAERVQIVELRDGERRIDDRRTDVSAGTRDDRHQDDSARTRDDRHDDASAGTHHDVSAGTRDDVSAGTRDQRRDDASAGTRSSATPHDDVSAGTRGSATAQHDVSAEPRDDLDDVRAVLVARWDALDVSADERRALAEALGKIGGEGVRARLEALDATSDKELARRRDRALLVADREEKRGEDSVVVVDRAPPQPLIVRLGCRPALAELLIAEARAAGFDGKAVRDDAVDVPLTGPWQALFASRLWATAAVRIEDRGLRAAKGDRAKVTDAIVKAIVGDEVRGLMTAWTRGPIRWRLSLARGHQRAVVWTVAKEVTRRTPELVNDPTQTTWDVRVDDDEGVLELVPRRAEDPRFAYRVAEVPAASHPSVAAAVVWLAGIAAGERVWDPFCGSGLELAEAARRGAGALIGSDLDDEALAAARANLGSAKADLVNGDARRVAVGPVDAIVTNPPLGSRVHVDAGALLAEALPHFARQVRPGGRLVWITPQWRRTTPVAEAHGFVLVRSLFVDLGGVRGRLERWDRRR